ncbi:MAG: hypothetical protein ACFFCZ_12715 [Promethearchaeota archaeon]
MGEDVPPKTVQVNSLHLEPVLDARLDELAGFYVMGLKRKVGSAQLTVGFLLSPIRRVSINPPGKNRFRVLLTFLPTGFAVQEEKTHWRRKEGTNSVFLVNFEDWEPVILEGEPQLDVSRRTFHNQWVEIKWSEMGIDIIPTSPPAHFNALLDSKHHKIELIAQELRERRAQ